MTLLPWQIVNQLRFSLSSAKHGAKQKVALLQAVVGHPLLELLLGGGDAGSHVDCMSEPCTTEAQGDVTTWCVAVAVAVPQKGIRTTRREKMTKKEFYFFFISFQVQQ